MKKIKTIIENPKWSFAGVFLGILAFFGIGASMITHTIIQYAILIIALSLAVHGIYRQRKQTTIQKVVKKNELFEKESKSSGGITCEMCGTEENAKLVIKSIETAKHGFKNFSDIVNDTNLPLSAINSALDWLIMNKFTTEANGRRGKIYELSPKGRDSFGSIINPKTI